jgi:hypothetical protein
MYAQNCTYYFPTKVGTVIETKTYLANDQLIGTNTVTILENTGGVIKCSNAKGETYEIECQDGKFTINMDSYIQQMKKSIPNGQQMKVETQGLFFPSSLSVGMKLDDASITFTLPAGSAPAGTSNPVYNGNNSAEVNAQIAKANAALAAKGVNGSIDANQVNSMMNGAAGGKYVVKFTNRQVVGKESITTPAGTFSCYKITLDLELNMGFTSQQKVIEWVCPNVGTVRHESHDVNGTLKSYSIITSIK